MARFAEETTDAAADGDALSIEEETGDAESMPGEPEEEGEEDVLKLEVPGDAFCRTAI